MMTRRTFRWPAGPVLLLVGAVTACGAPGIGGGEDQPEATQAVPGQPPAFVNKVWQVSASSAVERGTLYVFLGDGTLLITSAHGTPALGRWESAGAGLTLVEEGQRHPAEVLALTPPTFSIRVHSPGPPVDITFVPAR